MWVGSGVSLKDRKIEIYREGFVKEEEALVLKR